MESRTFLSVSGLSLSASPAILRPPSPANQPHAVTVQHVLPVTLAGEVTDLKGVPSLRYQVVDSFGRYQPSGSITVQPIGNGRAFYFTRIGLSDVRDPHTPGGRRYTVIVTAQDGDGSRQASAVVTVPPAGFFARLRRRPA